MAQIAKIVDITKSYLPIDPQAFAQNLSYTAREDDPEKGLPIIAFEGYNFLATAYGYRTYFGTSTKYTLDVLPSPCDEILSFQSEQYENMLIALCSDGVRTARAGSNAWTLIQSLPNSWVNSSVYKAYTWCVLENNLYIYRQGSSQVLKIADDLTHSLHTPSFLNMTGQMGMFRANGRLGFWDSEDSIGWSSAFDLFDFEPSIENMVGNVQLFSLLGRIVTIVPHGEGFVVYGTKSIIGVIYSGNTTTIWDASAIALGTGIAHPKAVCIGQTTKEHFAYTNTGIVKIGHFNALSRQYEKEVILPELYDFLREARDPVYLQCHASRYLYFHLINPNYIYGITLFTTVNIKELKAPIITIDIPLYDSLSAQNYIGPYTTFQILDSTLWNPTNALQTDQTQDTFEVPRWTCTMRLPQIYSYVKNQHVWEDSSFSKMKSGYVAPTDIDIEAFSSTFSGRGYPFFFDSVNEIFRNYLIRNYTDVTDRNKIEATNSNLIRSIFTNLLPLDILSEGYSGKSAWECIYNFLGVMDEYNTYLDTHLNGILESIDEANLHGYQYSLYRIDPLTLASPEDTINNSTPQYIPIRSGNIAVNFTSDATTNNRNTLNIGMYFNKYLRVHNTGGTRSVTNISEVFCTDLNPRPSGTIIFSAITVESAAIPVPDVFDYTTIRATAPTLISGGKTFRLLNPTMESVHGYPWGPLPGDDTTDAAHQLSWPILWINIAGYTDISDIKSGTATIANTVEYLARGGVNIPSGTSYEAYHLLYYNLYPFSGNVWYNSYFCSIEHAYEQVCLTMATWPGGINSYSVDGIAVQILQFVGYTMITPNLWILNARINIPLLGITNEEHGIIFVERSTTYKNDIIEFPNISVELYTIAGKDADNANFLRDKGTSFGLTLTHTGTDTIRKQPDGSLELLSQNTFFTPTWTEDTPDSPLTFLPSNEPYWKEFFAPNTVFQTTDCIPWLLTKTGTTSQVRGVEFMSHIDGTIVDVKTPLGPIPGIIEWDICDVGYEIPGNEDGFLTSDALDFTYPGASFILQDGIPVPGYPTFEGSLVFDLHLKKWGKQKNRFKACVELSPMNATTDTAIPYTNFGMDSGILATDGSIRLFSQSPGNSLMRYGKFGLYRLGFTKALEFILHFRTKSSGNIVIDGSLDGRDPDITIQHTESFSEVRSHVVKCDIEATWHTLAISGQFDLQFIEFRGIMTSRR